MLSSNPFPLIEAIEKTKTYSLGKDAHPIIIWICLVKICSDVMVYLYSPYHAIPLLNERISCSFIHWSSLQEDAWWARVALPTHTRHSRHAPFPPHFHPLSEGGASACSLTNNEEDPTPTSSAPTAPTRFYHPTPDHTPLQGHRSRAVTLERPPLYLPVGASSPPGSGDAPPAVAGDAPGAGATSASRAARSRSTWSSWASRSTPTSI